jgi:hypothetical protein
MGMFRHREVPFAWSADTLALAQKSAKTAIRWSRDASVFTKMESPPMPAWLMASTWAWRISGSVKKLARE